MDKPVFGRKEKQVLSLKRNIDCSRRMAVYAVFDVLDQMGCQYQQAVAGDIRAEVKVLGHTSQYQALTGGDIRQPRAFVDAVGRADVPMWVRHVVVPGLTDSDAHMAALRDYIKTLPQVERVELLPYHTLGMGKYAALGRPYSLSGVPEMDKARCAALEQQWFSSWNRRL